MKKLTGIVSGILAIGVLVTTGYATFAGSDTDANTDKNLYNTFISEDNTNRRYMRRGGGCFDNNERQEVTEEQRAEIENNMKERLQEQLKDGYITQEQYDQAISDIAEGNRPMYLGGGHGGYCGY